jgi:phenylacetate-coenzyme A ligase PaaK-like adenylate-forming protein
VLTLGSYEVDRSYDREIRRKFGLHLKINKDRNFYHQYQKGKIRWFLKEIAQKSPFYQSREFKILSDIQNPEIRLSELPPLEKQRLREISDIFISKNRKKPLFRAKTAGTTGVPLKIWFDHEYFISYFAFFHYLQKLGRIRPSPFDVSLLSLSCFRSTREDYWVLQPTLNNSFSHRMSIHPSFWESPSAILKAISSDNPLIIMGMPSTFEMLMGYVKSVPSAEPIRTRMIFTRSEQLFLPVRREIEKTFEAPVYNTYGLTEIGGIVAYECQEHQGLHINCVDFFVEVVDSDGQPVPDGCEGEILITNLFHRLVPLLRFRSGDYGILVHDRCPCGSITPRLLDVIGRKLNKFTLADGTAYHPYDVFGNQLWKLPVQQFQLVQKKDYQICLYYKAKREISDHSVVRALSAKIKHLYKGKGIFRLIRVEQFKIDRKFQVFLNEE